jgi:hypothetical protein
VPIGAGEEIRVTGVYPAIVTTQHVASGTNSVPTNPEPATSGAGSATVSPQPTTAGANPVEADGQPGPPKSNLAATNAQAASPDDFLSWVAPSDAGSSPRPSSRHASLEMTGYEELHPYGQWKTLDDYGPVWFPTSVPVEWAPYRFGHWTSISPWGWTWIDDQPWGFAPFHFGRWVRVDDRWAWAPGDSVDHPVYAPALVAFLETSGGLAATGPGEPPIGWFPLGPGDAYVPWFAAGPEYIQRVNVAYPGRFDDPAFRGRGEHGGKVWREEFANRRFATLMHREAFAYGRPVGREMIRMPADRLERAMVMRGAPRVTPAVMRTLAGPGGPHGVAPGMAAPGMAGPGGPHGIAPGMAAPGMAGPGGPHGIAPGMAAPGMAGPGGSRGIAPGMAAPGMAGPGGPHGVAPGMAGPGMAGPGGPRGVAPAMAAPGMAGPGGSHGVAPGMAAPGMGGSGGIGPGGANPRGFAGPGAPAVAAQMGRGVQPAPQQYGRQQVFQTPAPSYRPGAPQYGQPGVPRAPQMMGGRAPAMPARGAPSVAGRVAPQVAARPPPGGGGAPQQRPAPGGGGAAQHKK